MKKNLLTIVSLLFTAIVVNAQDLTSYRGAFAPAPVRQWTEDWTNFDPKNTVYPATTTTVSGRIMSDTTWTSNTVIQLLGQVYVDSGVTLTIQPGTIIRADTLSVPKNSSLIVQRTAKIIADGTQCRPIVFTSNFAVGSRNPGSWGGIIILGRARHNLGQNNLIEGMSAADTRNYHGGIDDDDNSGILRYVRIEFSGFIFTANNEINGLTMGSVGRGTQIDHIQVSYGNDDAFEWFGGNVNCKYLVSYANLDDDLDNDNGFSGIVQYALTIRDPALSDVSNSSGFESDNDNPGTNQARLPKTSAKFYNITQIGAFRCGSNAGPGIVPTSFLHRRGGRLRRNTDIKIVNSILMNNWRGVFIDGPLALANVDQDSLVFRNNIIAGDFTTTWTGTTYNGTKSLLAEDSATRSKLLNPLYAIDSVNTCALLLDAWNANPALADFRPNVAGDGAVVTDPTNLSVGADLTPVVEIDGALFTANLARDFLVDIFENGGGITNGVITVTIPKLSGWDIGVEGIVLPANGALGITGISNTSTVSGGTLNSNGNWLFSQDAGNVYATSKPGTILEKFGFVQLGFTATRKAGTPNGTNQNLNVSVSGGGDSIPGNNGAVTIFGAN